jgi:hypothetical protein
MRRDSLTSVQDLHRGCYQLRIDISISIDVGVDLVSASTSALMALDPLSATSTAGKIVSEVVEMTFVELQTRRVRAARKVLDALYRDITEFRIIHFPDGDVDDDRAPIPEVVGSEEIAELIEQISPLIGELQHEVDNLIDCR